MFKTFFVCAAIGLCAFSAPAYSTNVTIVDTTGLTTTQVAAIKAAVIAEQVATVTPAKGETTVTAKIAKVTEVATWGTQAATAAEGFAKALGIAAKELNVSVNEFLVTPAGILTAALIICKMFGAAVMHLLYGTIVIIVGLSLARVLLNRLFTQSVTSEPYRVLFGLFSGSKQVRVYKGIHDLDTDGEWVTLWLVCFIVMITLIFGAIII